LLSAERDRVKLRALRLAHAQTLDMTAALGEANKAAMDNIAITNPPASTSELCRTRHRRGVTAMAR
jgi:hypothetical protein